MSTYVFLGPTGHGVPRSLLDPPETTIRPPARRGDVAALLAASSGPPGEIVVVDGRFGDVLAVGHREILAALAAGWTVWGLASMGAIRAAELRDHGMKGFGTVYRRFVEDMPPDDEVAVLHGPGPDYRPLSEALVDLRAFLDHLVDARILPPDPAREVEAALAGRWFGERTLRAFVDLCGEAAGPEVSRSVRRELPALPRYRLKSADLRAFFAAEGGPLRSPRRDTPRQGDPSS
ncbi:TfuA-like protein [Actinomadura syzygii]|uniref:TfuA-like protein n=1 Tax=Actinomadura syzygii TaxID=1427538 RepID=UPI0016528EC5|nr:TfuA-like protein [Actinomadura syzygii]